jgi:hypothetical protein
LSLVCELNLGSGSFTETIAVRPSRMSSPVRLTFSFFSAPDFFGIIVERAGQRRAEGGQVGAAVALRDVVGEAEDLLVIAVVPLERDVDADIVALAGDGDRLRDERGLGAVEIAHERRDAALVEELDRLLLLVPRVGEDQAHAGIEEGELAEAVLELVEVELDDLEGGGEGRKVTRVPFLPSGRGPTTFSGASASPWRKRIQCSSPSRQMVSSSHSDSAFTTDTPTPCRPPDTL